MVVGILKIALRLRDRHVFMWNQWKFWTFWRLFRHILLIKDNSVFLNHLQWYWIRHFAFDWFKRLIIIKVFCFLCQVTSVYSGFIGSAHLFLSVTRRQKREREWMSKQCQKLSSKVKESFVTLGNSFCQSRYVYIYTLFTTSHLVVLPCRQYYLVYKLVSIIDLTLSDVAFSAWYLRFSKYWQYFFFLNLALNLSPFCSLLCSFTPLSPYFRVKDLLFVTHSPECSTNKAWFRRFCKSLSSYLLFICCVQEKQFC